VPATAAGAYRAANMSEASWANRVGTPIGVDEVVRTEPGLARPPGQ
jgi:hypothetical protein